MRPVPLQPIFASTQAHNGLQALDKATTLPDRHHPDRLVPSWGLDGLALFCRRLGDAEVYEGVNSDPSRGGRTADRGGGRRERRGTSVLVKPCSPERLLVEIIRVLSRTQRVGLVGEREDHHITVGLHAVVMDRA